MTWSYLGVEGVKLQSFKLLTELKATRIALERQAEDIETDTTCCFFRSQCLWKITLNFPRNSTRICEIVWKISELAWIIGELISTRIQLSSVEI